MPLNDIFRCIRADEFSFCRECPWNYGVMRSCHSCLRQYGSSDSLYVYYNTEDDRDPNLSEEVELGPCYHEGAWGRENSILVEIIAR